VRAGEVIVFDHVWYNVCQFVVIFVTIFQFYNIFTIAAVFLLLKQCLQQCFYH